VPRHRLSENGSLFVPEAVRLYMELVPGDFLEFVIAPWCRVLLGRVPQAMGPPVRPHGVLASNGTVAVPRVIQRHLQTDPGEEIEYLRTQDGTVELDKADSPRQRGGHTLRDSLGERGPGRGLDMLVSIGLEGE